MQLYIELLVLGSIGLMFALWFLWVTTTKFYHKWRYKPENDRGKKGEDNRQRLIREGHPDPIGTVAKAIDDIGGQGESEGSRVIPTADVNSVGKDSDGIRKSRRRRIFRRK